MSFSSLLIHAALLTTFSDPYPFAVGETLNYEAKLGYFPIGTATTVVARRGQERGSDALVLSAIGQGGPPGIRVRYELTSWVRPGGFASLRFHRRMVRGNSVDERRYQIVPDSLRYREEGKPQDWAAPPNPLDELAFLYYLRTVPLRVGNSYNIPRYFQKGYNPVQVVVSAREPVTLGDGTTIPCLALQISSRGTAGRVWLTDDARRLPAQLEVPLWFGNVTLVLTDGQMARRPGGQ